MKRFVLAAAAALALAACSDLAPTASPAEPGPARAGKEILDPESQAAGEYTIFTTQTPASTLDATHDPGWEVGTRFYVTQKACVIGFRFWRAAGETGTNIIKLWTNSGALRASVPIASGSTTEGWKYHYLSGFICLDVNTYYRVSVNTNTKQVKTFGAFDNGPIVNGLLTGNQGYYGQPTGSMPNTPSGSNFFVDVIVADGFVY